ncbi:MAG: alpha/beta fold hydrolase [Dehalococcoidales bacterium]|nr:alpha/beta fold hydrolase [Dehalococcoidales bacterium]
MNRFRRLGLCILALFIVVLIGVSGAGMALSNGESLQVSGTWIIETSITYSSGGPECICGPDCNNSLFGQSGTYTFDVQQSGSSFYSDSWLPITISGTIDNTSIIFSVILPDEASPDGCGDYLYFSGEISDNTISGSFSGHDCANNCIWAGNFNVTIVEELPTIEITKARMVSPSILGIDATVSFPDYDPEEGPRYVELRATINGQPIKEQIDVTDLAGPGETTLIEWVHTKRVYTKGLQIDLANTRDESGNPVEIPRFIKNEKFNLEAVAWSSTSGRSEVATKEVNILLPVIIVHGWTGESLVASIPFRIYESLIARLTKEGYTTDPSWYKTIWFESYSSQTWSPQRVAYWLDEIVGKAIKATYADRVNIIGHSLGGLVGRYYITRYVGASKVHKLIMVGTPNKGSSQFYIQTSHWSIDKVNRKLDNSPLAQWLIPNYQAPYHALYDIMNNPLVPPSPNNFPDESPPEGVTYYSIYNMAINTPFGLIVKPYRGWYEVINEEYYQTGGDGTVPWESAELESAINKPLVVSSGHAILTKDPVVQNTIIESLED